MSAPARRHNPALRAGADGAVTAAPSRARFGQEVGHLELPAWVNSVDWSPCGRTIAAACHDSSVHFWRPACVADEAAGGEEARAPCVVCMGALPMAAARFVNPDHVLAAGWDGTVCVLRRQADDEWALVARHGRTLSGAALPAPPPPLLATCDAPI